MPNFNQVTLLGTLTRPVEIKYLPSGKPLAEFSLAVNEKYTVEGEKREDVGFFDCVCFGPRAEVLSKYTDKGQPLLVSGKLKQDRWDDKATGQKRSKVVVVVSDFEFIGGKRDGGNSGPQGRTEPPQIDNGPQGDGVKEDDIPW